MFDFLFFFGRLVLVIWSDKLRGFSRVLSMFCYGNKGRWEKGAWRVYLIWDAYIHASLVGSELT